MTKYHSIKSEYKGRKYDSRKEANYAFQLDARKQLGEVKEWEPQYRFDIIVNGAYICRYTIDFKVTMKDDTVEFHETKGFSTESFKLRWKLVKAMYPELTFVLIK
jgi:hypothetical protein